MNIRHAAALTLVVWFLVFPQFRHDAKKQSWSLETSQALSKWRKSGPFNSLPECQQRLGRFRHDSSAASDKEIKFARTHHDDPDQPDDVSFMAAAKAQAVAAVCLEAGDPRLRTGGTTH
ncbi:MAG: hypothetical protein ACREQI_11020 [Candidatus Binataceae bacterium]